MYYIKFYPQDQFLFTRCYYTQGYKGKKKIDLGIKLNRAVTSVLRFQVTRYSCIYAISGEELKR